MWLLSAGRRFVQVRLVEPKMTSLNSGDCFILVTAAEIFLWGRGVRQRHREVKGQSSALYSSFKLATNLSLISFFILYAQSLTYLICIFAQRLDKCTIVTIERSKVMQTFCIPLSYWQQIFFSTLFIFNTWVFFLLIDRQARLPSIYNRRRIWVVKRPQCVRSWRRSRSWRMPSIWKRFTELLGGEAKYKGQIY